MCAKRNGPIRCCVNLSGHLMPQYLDHWITGRRDMAALHDAIQRVNRHRMPRHLGQRHSRWPVDPLYSSRRCIIYAKIIEFANSHDPCYCYPKCHPDGTNVSRPIRYAAGYANGVYKLNAIANKLRRRRNASTDIHPEQRDGALDRVAR